MQRSIKLKILRPCDDFITWEDIGYLLRGLSFTVCKVSNYCLTHRDELRRKIKEKAEARGIAVEEYTDAEIRIRCSRCGALNEQAANKRGFACSACGYGSKEKDTGTGYVSADYNAARNLAVYGTVNEK